MSTQKGSGNPPALDDILGRARNALNRSQQFRATNAKILGAAASVGPKVSQPVQPKLTKKPNIPIKTLIDRIPPLQKGTKSPKKGAQVPKKVQIETSSSSSEEDLRLLLRNVQDPSSQYDSEDASDSTITPPTITDTSAAKDNNSKQVTKVYKKERRRRRSPSPKNDAPQNSPRSALKTRDLVEKTIIARGDQMSDETYNAIKSMQISSKDGPSSDNRTESPRRASHFEELYLPPEEESYTEDFISEMRTLNGGSEGSFIEIPKTESTIEQPVSNEDFIKYSNDEDTLDARMRSASLSVVEEIRTNLQSLEVADKPSKGTQLTDGDDTDNPLDEFPQDDGEGQVKIMEPSSRRKVKDLRGAHKSNTDEDGDKSSITESSASTRSKSFYSKKVSYKEVSKRDSKDIQRSIDSKVSLGQSDAGLSTTSSLASGSRLSETKSFQIALAKIPLDEDDTHFGDLNGNIPPTKLPAKTKPQIKIHQILKQEVYVKELKRLRDLHKKEEKIMKKLNLVKEENLKKAKNSEAGVKNYLQPNYTKFLRKSSKESTSQSSSEHSSALVLHSDDVRKKSTRSPVPVRDTELFRERVTKMDLQHLVQEVVASNERMYNMTIAAANDMAKQHGKDAKLLMKIKRKREEKLRK